MEFRLRHYGRVGAPVGLCGGKGVDLVDRFPCSKLRPLPRRIGTGFRPSHRDAQGKRILRIRDGLEAASNGIARGVNPRGAR